MTEQKPAAEAHEEIREVKSQHAEEIARLRLTAEEREAIALAADELEDEYYGTSCKKELAAAATLRTLLERMK